LNYDQIPDETQNKYVNTSRLYRKGLSIECDYITIWKRHVLTTSTEYNAGRNQFAGDCKIGQLTQLGYLQQVSNGQFLREAYVEQYNLLK